VWILQTFIAIVGGLYTRWFHRWALLIAWATAMVWGTVTAYRQTVPNTKVKLVDGKPVIQLHGTRHFGASIANFPFTHTTMYIAISALAINIVIAVVLTVVFRALKAPEGADATEPDDYYSDGSMPAGEHVVVRGEHALSA
jgi:solute:Na+ symporter, SSS family